MPIVLSDSYKVLEFDYPIFIDPCPKYLLLFPPDPEERVQINGNADNNYLYGTEGHDLVIARLGNDTIFGSPGYDELRGGAGNDWVDYYDSHCPVAVNLETGMGWGGDAHGDTYFGIENIAGSLKDDTLTGNAGENVIRGRDGDDIIDGKRGDDVLDGDDGDDVIVGAAGDDTIKSSNGVDEVTGSGGADTFEFMFIRATTTITDFGQGADILHLIGFYDYAYFQANATEVGNDVVFTRDNNYLNYTATLIIEDVALADLSESDFLFN